MNRCVMKDIDYSKPIKVNNVSEEYQLLRQMICEKCQTMGQSRLIRQSLVFEEGKPYDILECECAGCGNQFSLKFDIASFFGSYLDPK